MTAFFSTLVSADAFDEYTSKEILHRNSTWAILKERDELHRDLNKTFNFPDSDGTFGIGKRSSVNKEYSEKYDQITQKYKTLYDIENENWRVWEKSYGLNVYEYLFFKDLILTEEDKNKLSSSFVISDGCILNSVFEHARYIIESKRGIGPSLKGTEFERTFTESIENHIGSAKYELRHHIKFFDLKFWEFRKKQFIKEYHELLTNEIRRQIDQKLNEVMK
jgi:hypothetical protein